MMRQACLSPAVLGLLLLYGPPAHAGPPPEPSASIGDDELAGLRGGQAITIANQSLSAITSGNSIGGNVSAGAVSLTDNAFSSFNGLGNIVINTGSQVSVQSGMNVTINVNQ